MELVPTVHLGSTGDHPGLRARSAAGTAVQLRSHCLGAPQGRPLPLCRGGRLITVTESPALAAGPVPMIRSAASRAEGGGPEGTETVGAVPAVPAAERAAAGMVAGGPEVDGGDESTEGAEVVGLEDELLHPARPRAAADSATMVRDAHGTWEVPFQRPDRGRAGPRREGERPREAKTRPTVRSDIVRQQARRYSYRP